LRAAVDLKMLGERQIIIDCDVLQADGGTRTAAITAGYVALHEAVNLLLTRRVLSSSPLLGHVAAVSCGIVAGTNVVDLEYEEDSRADLDCNIVMNESGGLIEIQGTAEQNPCSRDEMNGLLDLADKGIRQLILLQKEAVKA
jgi:ribonuclease PH